MSTVYVVIACAAILWLSLLFLWGFLACYQPPRRSRGTRRRPGYIRHSPAASVPPSRTTGLTRTRPATSTASSGRAATAAASTRGLGTSPAPSRTTSRISSGDVTATSLGDPTTGVTGPERYWWSV